MRLCWGEMFQHFDCVALDLGLGKDYSWCASCNGLGGVGLRGGHVGQKKRLVGAWKKQRSE
jgi:hypothetical protein